MRVYQAYRFALDPTPTQLRKICSHAGAARFAYNFGLALVKERLEQRKEGQDVKVPWNLYALRREWNRQKDEVAPWWQENSKEAANSGLASLAAGLKAFSDSRKGRRRGERIGFPRPKRKGRSRDSFRYTTCSFRVSGRTRVFLPKIGHVRTHEPTTALQKLVDEGKARILSATVSREGERWYCAFGCEVEREVSTPHHPDAVIGVDIGVSHLAVLSTGEMVRNPRALARVQRKLRRLQRKADRQRRANNPDCYDTKRRAIRGKHPIERSKRQLRTERQIRRLHARAAHIRQDALHKLTTSLAKTYGTIVCEHLNTKGLCRGGHRGLRRAIHDVSLAEVRRLLSYKCSWYGSVLVEAPVNCPSSKRCSSCGAVKAKLPLGARTYICEHCGLRIDRDLNAARNLAMLATTFVAGSGPETLNARSLTCVSPGSAGQWVDRESGCSGQPECKTGTACGQPQAPSLALSVK